MIKLDKRTLQLFAGDVDGDGDIDSTDQMLASMGGGGAAPSSPALNSASRGFSGNVYRNPGGPITTTQRGLDKIAPPMDLGSYPVRGAGGQYQFPIGYDYPSAGGMDYFGNAINVISPFQQAFNRMSMSPVVTGLGNALGLAGLFGLGLNRSQAPAPATNQQAAGGQRSFSAPAGNPVTSTGVVQAPNANLSAGYNPMGSLTPGNSFIPGQPQFNPSPLGQFGLDMYDRAVSAGPMLQRAGSPALTTPTTFTNPQDLTTQSLAGRTFRNR
jgi:hypothetical protein